MLTQGRPNPRMPLCCCRPSRRASAKRLGKSRLKFELAEVRLFLGYLRATVGLQCSPAEAPGSSTASLLQQYENHLRKDRGLAENSIRVYLPLVRALLASKIADRGFPQSLKALSIRNFVGAQTRNRSAEYVRLLATALRSFCRFLFLSGHLAVDLASSVPRVCKYRQSTPPAFLAPEEVTRALAAIDRSTPRGRRDYAILLLLARLGLRAGEIVSLELAAASPIDRLRSSARLRARSRFPENRPSVSC